MEDAAEAVAKIEFFIDIIDNLLVPIHINIEIFGGLASRHGGLNSFYQVASPLLD